MEAPFTPRDRKPPVRERTFSLASPIRIGVNRQNDNEGGKVDDSNHSKPVALELQPPTSPSFCKPTAWMHSKVDRELQLFSQRGTISDGEEKERHDIWYYKLISLTNSFFLTHIHLWLSVSDREPEVPLYQPKRILLVE